MIYYQDVGRPGGTGLGAQGRWPSDALEYTREINRRVDLLTTGTDVAWFWAQVDQAAIMKELSRFLYDREIAALAEKLQDATTPPTVRPDGE